MLGRTDLIARKEEVRAQIARVRLEIDRERARARPSDVRLGALEDEANRLMSEEHRLRQQIDRSQ